MKKITMPVIAMLLATACQSPSFAEDPVSRVDTYKEPAQKLRCVATCNSNPDPHQRVKETWYCNNGMYPGHCWGYCYDDGTTMRVKRGPCTDEKN
jgi:hypothetical protein